MAAGQQVTGAVATMMISLLAVLLFNQSIVMASYSVNTSVLLGGIFNYSSVGGLQRLEAFLLAVRQINSVTYLLNNTLIRTSVRDSSFDNERGSLLAADSIITSAADACISGSGYDTARTLSQSETCQISDSDTNAAFSNKDFYPYFARISASDAYQGIVMADIVANHYGW